MISEWWSAADEILHQFHDLRKNSVQFHVFLPGEKEDNISHGIDMK